MTTTQPTSGGAVYAECEAVTAASFSPVHLRPLQPDASLVLGGGLTFGALCGRVAEGWDTGVTHTADEARAFAASYAKGQPGHMCARCVQALPAG